MPARRIAIVFLAAGLLFLVPAYIRPDSIAVFAYLRSAVFDGDFAFFNEWASAGLVRDGATLVAEVTPIGALANHWWIGTSMLSLPPYLLAAPAAPRDGFSGILGVVLAWTNVAFAFATMLLAIRFVPRQRSLVLGAIAVGTPFFWYAFRFPLGTHIAGALCIGLVVLALRDDDRGWLLGLAVGFAIATRLQHVMLVPAVVFACARSRRPPRFWLAAAIAGALPIAAQAIAWTSVYGSPFGPLTSGGALEMTTWSPFRHVTLGTVLFTSYHGLFSWSPIVAFAIAGWFIALREPERRTLALTLSMMFAGEWLANGAFDRYFWGGMSFGARRFADLAVPFAIGLWWFAERVGPKITAAIAGVCALWSIALMIAASNGQLSLSRYVSPMQLIAAAFSPRGFPLRSSITDGTLFLQSIAAVLIVAIVSAVVWWIARGRRALAFALAYACALLAATTIIAMRTPERAQASAQRLGIDVVASRRFGPLVDQRGLLRDEIDWAHGVGDEARWASTEREIEAIDRTLAALERQRLATPSSSARPTR